MRKLFGVLALFLGLSAFTMMAPYIPAAPTVKVHVVRGVASCVVTWTDSSANTLRSEVRRRSTGADTIWSARGYVTAALARLEDPCSFGKTYRYEVRDSLSGVAFSGWSDSASVTVPTRKF